jgi:glycosidase
MGENIDIPGREAVRTPMQWSSDRNGGFSDAAPSRLVARPPSDGYAPEHVNVAAQLDDSGSLLHFIRSLASCYRISPELGWGSLQIIDQPAESLLVHSLTADVGRVIAVHNFAEVPVTTRFTVGDEPEGATLVDLLDPSRLAIAPDGAVELEVAAYGYRWLRVSRPGDGRIT